MFKLLLYDAPRRIETPLLWPTEIWLLLHGREQKEETTSGSDATAVLISHKEQPQLYLFTSDSKHQAGWPERGVEGMDPKRITTEL